MIKSIDQLKLTLLKLSDTERLDRHANVEIAFAERQDKIEMLEKALKQSQLECASVRSQMKEMEKSHKTFENKLKDCINKKSMDVLDEALRDDIEGPKDA